MLSAQNLEKDFQNGVQSLPRDLPVGKLWEDLLHLQLGWVSLTVPSPCCGPRGAPGRSPVTTPCSVCPFGGIPSQSCLRGECWQRMGRGQTLLSQGCTPSPVPEMVPRAVLAFSRGHSRVVPCSCGFAASAHLFAFAFTGITWAARRLEAGGCSSGLLTSGASAGHPQKELKASCKWGKGLGYFCRFQQQGSPLSWHQTGHAGVMTSGSSWVKSFYSRHSHSNKPQEGTDLWHIPTAGQPRAIGPAACASEDAVPLAGTCFHPKRGHQHPTRSSQGCP